MHACVPSILILDHIPFDHGLSGYHKMAGRLAFLVAISEVMFIIFIMS